MARNAAGGARARAAGEMRTEGNLHPALFPPADEPSSLLGHYKVQGEPRGGDLTGS